VQADQRAAAISRPDPEIGIVDGQSWVSAKLPGNFVHAPSSKRLSGLRRESPDQIPKCHGFMPMDRAEV
jgi:hypothetical protein